MGSGNHTPTSGLPTPPSTPHHWPVVNQGPPPSQDLPGSQASQGIPAGQLHSSQSPWDANTVGPMDAPWETPDPVTSVHQLKSLVGLGFSVGHDSAGDVQSLIHSAMGGIRKEVDQHLDYLETEHVEHKMDHQFQRKMVRFWKCSAVTIHESKTYTMGDHEQDFDQTYYQWTKMQNLPGWWIKKVWRSADGWLLVARKDEFNLLVVNQPEPVDQRNLVEETISSESSMESQRQNQAAVMSRRALQQFLHLSDEDFPRARSRSPRGARGEAAAAAGVGEAQPPIQEDEEATMPQAL